MLLVFVILLLVCGIGLVIYSVHSRLTCTEYQFQVDAVLTAASVENGGEALTDPGRAVIAEYAGKRFAVVPGNYTALSSYLRRDAASRLFLSVDPEKALRITVCDEAVFLIMPEDGSEDRVLIMLTTRGNTFRIRADGGNLWKSLLTCCTKGTYHDDNIPLD